MSFFVAALEHQLRTAIAAFRDSALYRFGWCYEQADDYTEIARQGLVDKEEEEDVAEPMDDLAVQRFLRNEADLDRLRDELFAEDPRYFHTPSDQRCIYTSTIPIDLDARCSICRASDARPSSPSSTIPPAQVDDEGGEGDTAIPPAASSPHPTSADPPLAAEDDPAEVSTRAPKPTVPSAGTVPNEISTAWRNGWYACELRHNIHPNQAERDQQQRNK